LNRSVFASPAGPISLLTSPMQLHRRRLSLVRTMIIIYFIFMFFFRPLQLAHPARASSTSSRQCRSFHALRSSTCTKKADRQTMRTTRMTMPCQRKGPQPLLTLRHQRPCKHFLVCWLHLKRFFFLGYFDPIYSGGGGGFFPAPLLISPSVPSSPLLVSTPVPSEPKKRYPFDEYGVTYSSHITVKQQSQLIKERFQNERVPLASSGRHRRIGGSTSMHR